MSAPPAARGAFSPPPLGALLTLAPGARPPWAAAGAWARGLRAALLAHAGTPSPRLLSGHLPDGRPDPDDHLAVVPLPAWGEGPLPALGAFALLPPRGAEAALIDLLDGVLARWAAQGAREGAEDGALPLFLPGAAALFLRPTVDPAALARAAARLGAAGHAGFATVSPIALDRHPGNLDADRDALRRAFRSGDPAEVGLGLARAARAREAAAAVIVAGLARQGLPAPEVVEVLPEAAFDGLPPVPAWPRFPADQTRPQRALVHARLRFAGPVAGPLLLGAGRFLGLGLLLPVDPSVNGRPN